MRDHKDKQKDFPELEQKPIMIPFGDTMRKAKVIGCNYHIGITVVMTEAFDAVDVFREFKVNEEVYCINGPNSPHKDRYRSQITTYDREFYACVRMIKRGIFDVEITAAITHKMSYPKKKKSSSCGSTYCGFSA